MHMILGHAGGIDEMAIFLMPVIVGVGVWILTSAAEPARPAQPAGVAGFSPHRAKPVAGIDQLKTSLLRPSNGRGSGKLRISTLPLSRNRPVRPA